MWGVRQYVQALMPLDCLVLAVLNNDGVIATLST